MTTDQSETVRTGTDVVLEARGVTKHFPLRRTARDLFARKRRSVHAVDDVSLRLRRGTVTALVGSPARASPPSPACSPSSTRSPRVRYGWAASRSWPVVAGPSAVTYAGSS